MLFIREQQEEGCREGRRRKKRSISERLEGLKWKEEVSLTWTG